MDWWKRLEEHDDTTERIRRIEHFILQLIRKVEVLMGQNEDLAAAVAGVKTDVAAVATDLAAVISNLQQAGNNPVVAQAISDLTTIKGDVDAIDTSIKSVGQPPAAPTA